VRFNADDFALTDGVCRGIIEAIDGGIVATTSAMICVTGAERRVRAHAARLRGRVGAHLQLTGGSPVSDSHDVASLVGADGRFPRRREGIGSIDAGELLDEWTRQFETLRSWGVEPMHIDTHHHVHTQPQVLPVYRELARRMGVPARGWGAMGSGVLRAAGVDCEDICVTDWYGEGLTRERLLAIVAGALDAAPEGGSIEVACHPGHADQELATVSSYARERQTELQVLRAPALAADLEALGAKLAGKAPER
jgi:predicted glycoside hydrolase/deacetylase ChbG (UPF0249 family)